MYKYVLTILLLVPIHLSFSQSYLISINLSNNSIEQSTSRGDKLIEFNNYTIQDIYANIMDIPHTQIEVHKSMIDERFDCKISSNKNIDSKLLKKNFSKEFKKYFMLDNNTAIIDFISIENSGEKKELHDCFDNENNGVVKKIKHVNRTWKGNCVNVEDIGLILEQWYGLNYKSKIPENKKFNLTLHHDNFDILSESILQRYGVKLKIVKTEVPIYTINSK